jgi:hypothetical protein
MKDAAGTALTELDPNDQLNAQVREKEQKSDNPANKSGPFA